VGALGFKIFMNLQCVFQAYRVPWMKYMGKLMFNRERSPSSTCEKVSIAGMRSMEYDNKLLSMKNSARIEMYYNSV
jgi:hypothetical protein